MDKLDETVDSFFKPYLNKKVELKVSEDTVITPDPIRDKIIEQHKLMYQDLDSGIKEENWWQKLRYSQLFLHRAAYVSQLMIKRKEG
jgi:hypothetical protein